MASTPLTPNTTIVSNSIDTQSTFPTASILSPITVVGQVNDSIIFAETLPAGKVRNYQFSMATGSLTCKLPDVGTTATVRLIRDVQNDRYVYPGDVITQSSLDNNGNQVIDIHGLGNSTYYLQVLSQGPGDTPYRMELAVQPNVLEPERENNDFPANAHRLDRDGLVNLNGVRDVIGEIDGSRDRSDYYRFKLVAPSKFSATASQFNARVQLSLYDQQGTKLIDSRHLRATSETVESDLLTPGHYLVQVRKPKPGRTRYHLRLMGTPVRDALLTVRIRRIKALDDFEGWGRGEADFYARVAIDGVAKPRTKSINNDDDAYPNFFFKQPVSVTKNRIPISIKIFESDGGSSDEHADISAIRNQRDLHLTYDTRSGKVFGGGITPKGDGVFITTMGNGDSQRAEVTFLVSYTTTV